MFGPNDTGISHWKERESWTAKMQMNQAAVSAEASSKQRKWWLAGGGRKMLQTGLESGNEGGGERGE